MTNTSTQTPHPAKFSKPVLAEMDRMLPESGLIVDPFGGTGMLAKLERGQRMVVCYEIEPEWAEQHPNCLVGDALDLPYTDGVVTAIGTSPTFGNRLADKQEPIERCRKCNGEGEIERLATPEEVDAGHELGIAYDKCDRCGGKGQNDYDRITYRHKLGRELHPNNSGGMQWGPEYRAFHVKAWAEAARVLMDGGTFVLNIKDHVRDFKRQHVSMWHVNTLGLCGLALMETAEIESQGNRKGQNRHARIDTEYVMRFVKV